MSLIRQAFLVTKFTIWYTIKVILRSSQTPDPWESEVNSALLYAEEFQSRMAKAFTWRCQGDLLLSKDVWGVPLSMVLYCDYLALKAVISLKPSVKKCCLDGCMRSAVGSSVLQPCSWRQSGCHWEKVQHSDASRDLEDRFVSECYFIHLMTPCPWLSSWTSEPVISWGRN